MDCACLAAAAAAGAAAVCAAAAAATPLGATYMPMGADPAAAGRIAAISAVTLAATISRHRSDQNRGGRSERLVAGLAIVGATVTPCFEFAAAVRLFLSLASRCPVSVSRFIA